MRINSHIMETEMQVSGRSHCSLKRRKQKEYVYIYMYITYAKIKKERDIMNIFCALCV